VKIVLIKQTDARLEGVQAESVRGFLFHYLKGATAMDDRAWRRFVGAMNEGAAGEYFSLNVERKRSGKFHRLSMAILSSVFKAQDRFDNFDLFRAFVKLGAGFVDYVPNADGELRAIPKSVSFDQCSEEEIREFHQNAVAFMRTARAQKTLWPDASPAAAEQGLEAILSPFEEF
jgi:Protein of unknown function (DUF1367)